jgi:hypothetical protein
MSKPETTLAETTGLCVRIAWLSLKLLNAVVTNIRLWLFLTLNRILP